MKLPILTTVLIFTLVLAFFIHRGKEQAAKEQDSFWERERAANNTRRKSLDSLEYITIPVENLPTSIHIEDDTIKECIDTIVELAKSPIVNLTGISNTDLKLKYGAPNIDLLSIYDQRYTNLVCTLQKWAEKLYEYGEKEATRAILEFAISTRTDVSGSYRLLCSIYQEKGDTESIKALLPIAENLHSPMRDSIISHIKSSL